ncbi:SDR family oxidoreductase [Kitasatospora sp. NBC_00315]|uniref:SDR family oxidoreductase n=1 Tax=Kitasatospora sp. NBC_00315 TaxID=2975963 RepID=UPI003256587C
MTILVTGGRGRIARTLTRLLHARGVPVRVGTAADPAALDVAEGVGAVHCDLGDPAGFPAALDGCSAVFLYAARSHAEAFADRAAEAGVRHIVLLSSSSVLAPDAEQDALGGHHVRAERALRASPVLSTFLRPGAFAANALQWARPIRSTGAVGLPYPGAHCDPIHESDVAEAALAALTDPDRLGGRAHHLTGPQSLTFRGQIEQIADVLGRPLGVDTVGRQEWERQNAGHMPAHFAQALLDLWKSADGVPVPLTRTVEELTGHPARPFALWAKEHAADFSA